MPRQVYAAAETVLEAARRRIAFVFDHYERVICSISGGKDSTVLAHLALVEAHKRGRKLGLYFLDEEATYQSSVDQVEYLMGLYPDNVTPLWLQVQFRLTNAVSVEQGQLECWEEGASKVWMRNRAKGSIKHAPWDRATQTVRDKNKGFGFYDAIENFERCYERACERRASRSTDGARWSSTPSRSLDATSTGPHARERTRRYIQSSIGRCTTCGATFTNSASSTRRSTTCSGARATT
jgi:predicted phosphoadenosine phosphosulfate sulfurtransferase